MGSKKWNPYSRRAFVRRLLAVGTMLGWTLRRARAAEAPPNISIPLDKVPPLQEVMGGVLLKLRGRKVLLIRTDKMQISALDPECRHKKCKVLYKKEWGEIRCDCHGSKYDVRGKVIYPPATKDLRHYPVRLDGDQILLNLTPVPDED